MVPYVRGKKVRTAVADSALIRMWLARVHAEIVREVDGAFLGSGKRLWRWCKSFFRMF